MTKVVALRGATLVWTCPKCEFKHTAVVSDTITFDMNMDLPPEMMIHVLTEGHYVEG